MYPIFPTLNSTDSEDIVFCKSDNDVSIEKYPEYNVPPLQLPCIDDPKELVTIHTSELYDLFNVERLGGMSSDVIASIRNNILQGSQFASEISKCSDDEIMETIKPRNLQSPSQLVLWSKHLQYLLEERLQQSSNGDVDTSTVDTSQTVDSTSGGTSSSSE